MRWGVMLALVLLNDYSQTDLLNSSALVLISLGQFFQALSIYRFKWFLKKTFWITILSISSVQLLFKKILQGPQLSINSIYVAKILYHPFIWMSYHFLYSTIGLFPHLSPSHPLFPWLCFLQCLLSPIFIQIWF